MNSEKLKKCEGRNAARGISSARVPARLRAKPEARNDARKNSFSCHSASSRSARTSRDANEEPSRQGPVAFPSPDQVEAVTLRNYQRPIFDDHRSGIVVLHWSRQIGKSYTLAAWAVWRLLTRPGRLVTVLSNSRDNGAEFVAKCAEICRLARMPFDCIDERGADFADSRMEVRVRNQGRLGRIKVLAANPRTARGFSGDLILDEFAFHEDSAAIWEAAEPILASNPDFLCRIASTGNGRHNMFYRMVAGKTGSRRGDEAEGTETVEPGTLNPEPRTADAPNTEAQGRAGSPLPAGEISEANIPLHQEEPHANGESETVEPRTAETPDKLKLELQTQGSGSHRPVLRSPACGTEGGREAAEEPKEQPNPPSDDGGYHYSGDIGTYLSGEGFKVSRVTRTMAHTLGVPIYDPQTRQSVTPEQARAYDQNYECSFADESMTLLSHELITAAERDGIGFICDQDWSCPISSSSSPSSSPIEFFRSLNGRLFVGFDVGRNADLSVITVVEKIGETHLARGILRMRELRLPEQQLRLGEICRLPRFYRAAIDMTGIGLGLFEYAQKEFGYSRIRGINFAATVPATRALQIEGRPRETVRVTEAMATELLRAYEDRRIQHPRDAELRDDLRKPGKITSPGGRVSIAATRDEAGHADHFWSLALAIEAGRGVCDTGGGARTIPRLRRSFLL